MKSEISILDTENNNHWEKFYAGNINLNESTFCMEVMKQFRGEYLIVDIGCGSGRDSFSFAEKGLEVIAVDRSQEAIYKNMELAKERMLSRILHFDRIDLGDESRLKKLFEKIVRHSEEKNKTIILYLRFLLHAIDEETEKTLLDVIANNLPKGSYFAAEFRTIEDEHMSKTYDDHYRRFICAETFVDSLKGMGFLISDFYKGTGLSKYKEEDPFLARVFAEKI